MSVSYTQNRVEFYFVSQSDRWIKHIVDVILYTVFIDSPLWVILKLSSNIFLIPALLSSFYAITVQSLASIYVLLHMFTFAQKFKNFKWCHLKLNYFLWGSQDTNITPPFICVFSFNFLVLFFFNIVQGLNITINIPIFNN